MRAKAVVVALIALAVLSSLSIFTRGRGGPSEGQPAAPSVEVLMSFSGGDGDPTYFLEVVGDENFQIRSAPGGVRFFIDNDGNVGIGTTSPSRRLTIEDSGENLSFSFDGSNFLIEATDDFKFMDIDATNSMTVITIEGNGQGNAALKIKDGQYSGTWSEFQQNKQTFELDYGDTGTYTNLFNINPDGNDVDIRFEGVSDENLLFIDAGNNKIGIGTTSPSDTLHLIGTDDVGIRVEADSSQRPHIDIVETGDSNYDWRLETSVDRLYFKKSIDDGSNWSSYVYIGGVQLNPYFRTYSSSADLEIGGGNDIIFTTYTTSREDRMIITEGGDVGIGTTSPGSYRLYVDGGPLYVSGDIDSGGTKNFVIPHPAEDDMQLVHSTLEGPEAAVFYRGEAQLVNGQAVVELPDYFEALTRAEGRTVLLTCLNGWSPLYVDGGVEDGRFTVRTTGEGDPAQEFYWEVKAVRADVPPLEVERPA